jgi:hypothetical protein
MKKSNRHTWPCGKVAYHLPDLTAGERERLKANVVYNPDQPFGCWGW